MATNTAHPLDGAREKLKRANENILNLEREIAAFLEQGPYPVIPQEESGLFEEAIESHINRVIPLRFSVLIGEVIHNLRSCLDHVAWELSTTEKRTRDSRGIEFPIYLSKPVKESELRKYQRKIEGISPQARAIIEMLQPYQRDSRFLLTGPRADPLWIIHKLDTTDKHRELVLTEATFSIATNSTETSLWLMLYREADFPEGEIAGLGRAFHPDSKITTQISFRDIGGRKIQPVIPLLRKLARYVEDVLGIFEQCF